MDLETSGGAMRPCREVLKAPKVREDLPARTEVQVSQEPADRKVIQERHGFRGDLVGDFLHSNLGPPPKNDPSWHSERITVRVTSLKLSLTLPLVCLPVMLLP